MIELINNIGRIHTTPMGIERINRNLSIDADSVEWCKAAILSPESKIQRQGKNYYVTSKGAVITVNAHSLTIITAHRIKENL